MVKNFFIQFNSFDLLIIDVTSIIRYPDIQILIIHNWKILR